MRKKGMMRIGQRFVISGELVQNVQHLRYLGWGINEHEESKVIVDSRASAEARALCVWLRRCRVAVRVVYGAIIGEGDGSNGGVSLVVQSRGMGIL